MILLVVLILLFAVMTVFPFLVGRASLDPKRSRSLIVKSENVRDPRYFPKAFAELMERALEGYDGSGSITLSRPEKLAEPPLPPGDAEEVVFSAESFKTAEPRVFRKEIYCRASARIAAGTTMRAVACLGGLYLEENCRVERWADGETSMVAKSGCTLGISASSENYLRLEAGCSFRRLYARRICVGRERAALNPPEPLPPGEIHRDIRAVEDMDAVSGNIICRGDLVVGEYAEITGSVKARGRIHIKRGVRVTGNVVAEGEIVLENNVLIEGTLFSQERIFIGPDCQLGREGRIKSVVARGGVTISEGALIFGYVSGEEDGETVAAADYFSLISDRF